MVTLYTSCPISVSTLLRSSIFQVGSPIESLVLPRYGALSITS
jgi:hypothetical protein